MYAPILRSANGTDELSERQMRASTPSIYATQPRGDVTSKYAYLSTIDVLKTMRDEGFVPVEVRQHMRRLESKRGFARHIIKFRLRGDKLALVGDCVPQVVFLNSHDRSSKAELYGGLFRLVCLNGLIVSDSGRIVPVIVRHTARPVEEFMRGVADVVKGHKRIAEHVKAMRGHVLTEKQQLAFARAAMELREGPRKSAIAPERLLVPRRLQDAGADLWRVMNRVQENLLRGGVEGITSGGKLTHTRPVTGLHQDMQINMGVWEMAMQAIDRARKA